MVLRIEGPDLVNRCEEAHTQRRTCLTPPAFPAMPDGITPDWGQHAAELAQRHVVARSGGDLPEPGQLIHYTALTSKWLHMFRNPGYRVPMWEGFALTGTYTSPSGSVGLSMQYRSARWCIVWGPARWACSEAWGPNQM